METLDTIGARTLCYTPYTKCSNYKKEKPTKTLNLEIPKLHVPSLHVGTYCQLTSMLLSRLSLPTYLLTWDTYIYLHVCNIEKARD